MKTKKRKKKLTKKEQEWLLEEHRRLPFWVVNKLRKNILVRRLEFDDAVQIAWYHMTRSVLTFDPARGKFSTYATKIMIRYLLAEAKTTGGVISLPPNASKRSELREKQNATIYYKSLSGMQQKGETRKKMEEALVHKATQRRQRTEEEEQEDQETYQHLLHVMKQLSTADQESLYFRYWQEMKLIELGVYSGITNDAVGQRGLKAKRRLEILLENPDGN